MFLYFLIAAIVLLWVYILWIRPWLARRHPATWAWLDNTEGYLYKRSRQVLVARMYILGGLIIMAHDALASFGYDFTPILNQITGLVSEPWRPYVLAGFVILNGIGMNYLRRSHASESMTGAAS